MNSLVDLSRRSFLKSTAGFAALAGPMRLLGAAAKSSVIVGAHPWVYAAKRPGFDIIPILPSIFADMEYAGFDGIELIQFVLRSKDACEQVRQLSQKHHLQIIGCSFMGTTGTSFTGRMCDRAQHRAILDEAELIVPRLAQLGGRTLGISVGAVPQRKTGQQLDDQADLLRQLIALCARHGVVLNLHNHTYEVADDMHDLKGTLSRIPDVKLGPDLGWLARAGVDPVSFIRQYGRQIVFLHLRDQKESRWSEAMGEGDMDYAAIGRALHEVGFQGDAVVELAHEKSFQPTRPLRESLKQSRAVVKEKLGY